MLIKKLELDVKPEFKPIKLEITIESLAELADLYQRLNSSPDTITRTRAYEIPNPNNTAYYLFRLLRQEIEHLVKKGIIKRRIQ